MLVAGLIGGLVVGLTLMYGAWRLVRSLDGVTRPEGARAKDEKENNSKE